MFISERKRKAKKKAKLSDQWNFKSLPEKNICNSKIKTKIKRKITLQKTTKKKKKKQWMMMIMMKSLQRSCEAFVIFSLSISLSLSLSPAFFFWLNVFYVHNIFFKHSAFAIYTHIYIYILKNQHTRLPRYPPTPFLC